MFPAERPVDAWLCEVLPGQAHPLSLKLGRRIIGPFPQSLHALPEFRTGRLADLVEVGRLAPHAPRVGMKAARRRELTSARHPIQRPPCIIAV